MPLSHPQVTRYSSREVRIRVPTFLLSILVGEPSPKKCNALLGDLGKGESTQKPVERPLRGPFTSGRSCLANLARGFSEFTGGVRIETKRRYVWRFFQKGNGKSELRAPVGSLSWGFILSGSFTLTLTLNPTYLLERRKKNWAIVTSLRCREVPWQLTGCGPP